jgi:hypothetical protein
MMNSLPQDYCGYPPDSIPAYDNPNDACTACALLSYLNMGRTLGVDSLEYAKALSGYVRGRGTWPYTMLLKLAAMHHEIVVIEDFDYDLFAADGAEYLKIVYPVDMAVNEGRDVTPELMDTASKLARSKSIRRERRVPTIGDVQRLIADGYVVFANTFDRGENGDYHWAHTVLLFGYNSMGFFLVDSQQQAQKGISRYETFECSWTFKTEGTRSAYAVRDPARVHLLISPTARS